MVLDNHEVVVVGGTLLEDVYYVRVLLENDKEQGRHDLAFVLVGHEVEVV